MRILHTADWHVGRALRGRDRSEEHRAVLAEITSIAAEREADLVLVAGDLFDTAAPAPVAEQILYEALLALARTGATVVIIAGNHDNPQRLRAVKPILESGCGVFVGASVARPEDGGVIAVRTRSGEVASLALLPFLSQRQIVRAADLMEKDAFEHGQAYADRFHSIAAHLTAALDPKAVRILVAHPSVIDAKPGGGERAAHSGLDYAVSGAAFDPSLHYVALGHYHRTQSISAACPVWYAGAPLALDFGDDEGERSVLWVEARADLPATVTPIPLRAGRRLRRLRGSLTELAARLPEVGDAFLRVEVTEDYRSGLGDEVRALFPNAVDVRIEAESAQARSDRPGPSAEVRAGGSPVDLFATFLTERKKHDARVVSLFRELLDERLAAGTPSFESGNGDTESVDRGRT